MSQSARILIVGGGASGLACALSCARLGADVRIVEKRASRTSVQKATGVAQGVWHQLADFGITERVISDAIPMRRFVFHDDEKLVADLRVPDVNGEPPAHLYPQAMLEQAMEEALAAYGVQVEYGRVFASVVENADGIEATIRDGDETEIIRADWLVGADGGKSAVRSFLDAPFVGRDYPEDWSVAEIETETWPQDAQAQLFLQANGVGLFLSQPRRGVVQGIFNAKGVASRLTHMFQDARLLYEREFRVSLRRVPSPRIGRIWLIGDAAHVQSPVGGQGLNLAIWDGVTLGRALARHETEVEKTLRDRARSVLRFTHFDYLMLSTKWRSIQYLRNSYWKFAGRFPRSAAWFFTLISGVW
ncbi:FAD-dependent oxidoreductase [Agrobacterium cavarae]